MALTKQELDDLVASHQPKPTSTGDKISTALKDTALSLGQGVIGLGQAGVGLADLATGGLAGQALSKLGYNSSAEQQIVNSWHSPEFQASQQAVADAGNIDGSEWDKAKNTIGATLANPRALLTGTIPESLPMMIPGVAAGRGIIAGAKGLGAVAEQAALRKAMLAGSASEGAITAGQIADQAQQANNPYSTYAPAALKAGALTAGIGALSGRLLGDADTGIAAQLAGVQGRQLTGSLPMRIGKGFAAEGLAEEAPQSAQEQYFTNIAMQNPNPMEGMGAQAATGLLAGGLTGGAMAGLQGGNRTGSPLRTASPEPQPTANTPLSRAASLLQPVQPSGLPDFVGANRPWEMPAAKTDGFVGANRPWETPAAETQQQKLQRLLAEHGTGVIDQYAVETGLTHEATTDAFNKIIANEPKTAINILEHHAKTVGKVAQPEKYNAGIQGLANELQVNGDSTYIKDANDKIIGRTPSVNPDWFKDGAFSAINVDGKPMRRKPTVTEIKNAVAKHYAGEKISGFEAGILRGLDDVIKQKQAESSQTANSGLGGYEDLIPQQQPAQSNPTEIPNSSTTTEKPNNWQQPNFKINPDAQAIVNNATIKGQGTQAAIDAQYQNPDAYNPLAGTWEKPQATDKPVVKDNLTTEKPQEVDITSTLSMPTENTATAENRTGSPLRTASPINQANPENPVNPDSGKQLTQYEILTTPQKEQDAYIDNLPVGDDVKKGLKEKHAERLRVISKAEKLAQTQPKVADTLRAYKQNPSNSAFAMLEVYDQLNPENQDNSVNPDSDKQTAPVTKESLSNKINSLLKEKKIDKSKVNEKLNHYAEKIVSEERLWGGNRAAIFLNRFVGEGLFSKNEILEAVKIREKALDDEYSNRLKKGMSENDAIKGIENHQVNFIEKNSPTNQANPVNPVNSDSDKQPAPAILQSNRKANDLSKVDFYNAIEQAPDNLFEDTIEVDWGKGNFNKKGHGSTYLVDLQGIKTTKRTLGKLYNNEEDKRFIQHFNNEPIYGELMERLYAKARAAGFSPETSFRYSLEKTNQSLEAGGTYRLALEDALEDAPFNSDGALRQEAADNAVANPPYSSVGADLSANSANKFAPTEKPLSTQTEQKHEAYAQEIAGNNPYQKGNSLNKAREAVKEKYNQLKDRVVILKPNLSIKDVKIGDDVYFPATSKSGQYGGKVKKINRTTMVIENDFMGKPQEIKVNWGENGRITRGNELIFSSETDFNRLNEMMGKLGIEKNNPENQANPVIPDSNNQSTIPLTTPTAALNHIIQNTTTPLFKILAKKLLGNLPNDITIITVNDLPSKNKNYAGIQAKGRYNRNTHALTLNLSVLKTTQDMEKVLLHELIHAATLNNISTNTAASRELKRISKLIEKYTADKAITDPSLKGMVSESIRSIEELVTYGLTDSKLQALLKEIQDGERTLWDKFVVAIARAIGFDSITSGQKTALESLLQVSSELIGESSNTQSLDNAELESINFDGIKDFFTGEPAQTHSLADIYTQLNSGKPLTAPIGKQHYFDKIVTAMTDLTRPFDRFILNTFKPEQAAPLIDAKDRAQGIKQAYEKQALDKFGRPLSTAVRAIAKQTGMKYKTAKDMAGYWMSATYAPEANAFLMAKDQRIIDDLQTEYDDLTDAIDTLQAAPSLSADDQQLLDTHIRDRAVVDKQLRTATDKAQKRRAAINDTAIIDPTQQPLEVGLAGGFNNATAAQLVKDIEAKIPQSLLKDAAKPIYAMLKWKLENDIKDGKTNQETVDNWLNSPNYVPLTGDPRTDDSVEEAFMTGGVNQSKDHALQGRATSIAQNGIDAAFEQMEKSARYHGWNDFKDELHSLYNSLHADLVATGLTDKQASEKIWQDYELKRRPADTQIPAGENDIIYRKDNKGYIYTFNNQAAMEALRHMNDETVPSILKPIQAVTSLQSKLVTMLMAGFAPTNTLRDTLEKSENIRMRKITGLTDAQMNTVGNDTLLYGVQLLKRLKTIAAVLAENTPIGSLLSYDPTDSDVIKLKEYLSLGGSSTYGEMLARDSKQLADKLEKLGTRRDKGWSVLLLYNSAFETISGFAVYKALLDQGVDPKKSATESLNLMNFRKRGRLTSPLRALYMFVNPTAQGAHQLAKTLSTQRGRMRFVAYALAASLLYIALRSADGDDDEIGFNRMDEQSNFQLYRNIHIPIGDGEYLKIPVGFGMQQLAWAHGVNLVRTALGSMTLNEALAESAWLWAKAAAPVAPSETSIAKSPMVWAAQTLTPQAFKPLVNIALDVTAFGSPLTNARYEKTDTAHALQGKKQTPQEYKDLAKTLANISDGYIDFYPEEIKALVNGYAIGHLGDIVKVLIENPTAESLGKHVINPSLDRWLVAQNDEKIRERMYYRLRDKMNEAQIKRSTGAELTDDEQKIAELGDKVKKMEAKARGKNAAATRAEKQGQTAKAQNLRNQAEKEKRKYMELALKHFI